MLLVISPAKSLDYETPATTGEHTVPDFMDQSQQLVKGLKKLSPAAISELMGVSDKLAQLNTARYQSWSHTATVENAKQAVLAFTGDVYVGLDATRLNKAQLSFSQKHLRILSGLYGVLRPLDLMQPYRLEMGTKFANSRGKDLYAFWGEQITDKLNDELAGHNSQAVINLASNEYFKAVKPQRLQGEVITPVFKDLKNGQYKIISFYAKKARGLMCRYAIDNKITQPERLKGFDYGGYAYNEGLSSGNQWVFTRDSRD
ncbi:peroxide stress protein YaaA [Candidatus Sororendozoicomonas aggregata]|uniref:peroxide stress protein YaaA n=1 Tax=Candidatus Sororendozoicomonas aggregata TaxID=3073239 RepID=UPI002ED5F617